MDCNVQCDMKVWKPQTNCINVSKEVTTGPDHLPSLRQKLANKEKECFGRSKLNSFANNPHKLSNRNVGRDKKFTFVNAWNSASWQPLYNYLQITAIILRKWYTKYNLIMSNKLKLFRILSAKSNLSLRFLKKLRKTLANSANLSDKNAVLFLWKMHEIRNI